jgi:hypothetical protein
VRLQLTVKRPERRHAELCATLQRDRFMLTQPSIGLDSM